MNERRLFVIHERNSVCPDDNTVHTQNIENVWMRAKKKTYINLILIAYSAIFRTASPNSNTRVFYASVHTSVRMLRQRFYQDLNFINPASTDVMIFITPASTYTVFFHQSR